ncbi:MAG: hypothetical protein KDD85_02800 [Parvularculaceae bacterium]|nr:hypothetical protein [Parvularculaceae bacterium]
MIRMVIVACATVLLSGCAFTVYDVPLNYSYASDATSPGPLLPAIRVGEITDGRDVKNPRMILNQTNANGQTTTGGWQAEKNLSVIVREAIVSGAAKYAAAAPEGENSILLTGELTDVTDQVVTGFWTAELTMKIGVRFTATDQSTGEIVWRDTITGEAKSGKRSNAKSMVVESFNGAVTEMVDNLFADTYFRQQIAKVNRRSSATS